MLLEHPHVDPLRPRDHLIIATLLVALFVPGSIGVSLYDRDEGWYGQIGYFFVPEKLQAIVRHESYDPDTAVEEENDIAWTTVGLNYFIRGHALRIQVNYIFKDERTFDIDNNTFLLELQATF